MSSFDERDAVPTAQRPGFARLHARTAMLKGAELLRRARVAGPAFRVYERLASLQFEHEEPLGPDGLSVPPPHLRMLVAGGPGRDDFLSSGELAARSIADLADRTGSALDQSEAVLDFGCGCGRIARHWAKLPAGMVHGCDYNDRLVRWTAANLPFVDAFRNELAPPLACSAERFDFVYAISVFTHLTGDLQHAWMAEVRRILRPGGRLLFTTHGHAFGEWMEDDMRVRFEAGEMVERFPETPGSNLCSTYHPPAWVRQHLLADGWDVRMLSEGGVPGLGLQDVYVAERK